MGVPASLAFSFLVSEVTRETKLLFSTLNFLSRVSVSDPNFFSEAGVASFFRSYPANPPLDALLLFPIVHNDHLLLFISSCLSLFLTLFLSYSLALSLFLSCFLTLSLLLYFNVFTTLILFFPHAHGHTFSFCLSISISFVLSLLFLLFIHFSAPLLLYFSFIP